MDMEWNVILEFPDGHSEEATLARPFMPDENLVNVLLAKSGEAKFLNLDVLCCILMIPKDFPLPGKEHSYELIITVAGKYYQVAIPEDQHIKTGFYGISNEADNPYKLVFFPAHGVKSREKLVPLGVILEEKNLITPDEMEKALEEQKQLKEKRLGAIISEEHGLPQKVIETAIEAAYREGRILSQMRVGDILIESGLVTKEQVESAVASQEKGRNKRIGVLLVEKGLITEKQLLMALSVKFHLTFIDLDTVTPTQEALDSLSVDIVRRLKVIPVENDGKRVVIATSEPTDLTLYDTLRFYFQSKQYVDLVLAVPQQISAAILKYYTKSEYMVEDIISGMTENVVYEDSELKEKDAVSESDSQVVSLVNQILIDGFGKGASDIHFEPGGRDQPVQVRYRVDGRCRVVHTIPRTFRNAVISRIKIMSNLDISERRKPQSGKIIIWHKNEQIEYRVEITPTVGRNEDAVLRILTSSEPLPLEEMDFSKPNLQSMKDVLSQPYGIVLCVGPTGSGKTTTLHAALKHLNTPEVKIWTVEDPVEITQRGLRQVQVLPKIGVTFHEVLRSFLRADPDIIMIGEMRDTETAKTAVEASLTGHLVLSTLHTNSASETVVRLIDMGIDPFNFADAFLGVLAQRLARRICDKCKTPYHPDRQEYDRLVEIYGEDLFTKDINKPYSPGFTLMRGVGCETCNGTGYKGRVAIHELLISSERLKALIRHKAGVDELKKLGIEQGMRTLLMDGIEKVIQGTTDLKEVLKICRYEKKDEGSIINP
jgi:type II secretory ATPase GspE/PulE/Tfp pilus assembly ATPase PilB-like protein